MKLPKIYVVRGALFGVVLGVVLGVGAGACDRGSNGTHLGDGGTDPDSGCIPEVTFADPLSFPNPEAVLITTEVLRYAFVPLVTFHTQTGTPTRLVTLAEICAAATCDDADPLNDTAKAIKDYIAAQPGLRYVVLGGDLPDIPSRRTHDLYENAVAGTYEEDFYTDYYYSDLSEWDTNGDGVYGDAVTDSPDYRPEVSVSRIPISSGLEARRYVEKVLSYSARYEPSHVQTVLLLANIAANVMNTDFSSARYFEEAGRTIDALPADFSITKLYAQSDNPDPTALDITRANQVEQIEAGVNLIVHNGHGYPDLLTAEQVHSPEHTFSGDDAYALVNTTYPIFFSGACQAGQFEAPFIWNTDDGDFNFPEDSAGEKLITAPEGGAIAYVGNTTTGLGLAGGSQFIDEALRDISRPGELLLADAFMTAHAELPEHDTFVLPLVGDYEVVDSESYRWTQKAVVLLGDGLIPVWNRSRQAAPTITATAQSVCGGVVLEVQVSATDVHTVYVGAGEQVYELDLTDGSGSIALPYPDTPITVAASSSDTFYLYYKLP
jgi:Peptidase family C25